MKISVRSIAAQAIVLVGLIGKTTCGADDDVDDRISHTRVGPTAVQSQCTLTFPPIVTNIIPPPVCPITTIDFNELEIAEYVREQYVESNGVLITAIRKGSNGFTPIDGIQIEEGGSARILDSTRPRGIEQGNLGICDQYQGDNRLGSPNRDCEGGGVGRGDGGKPTLSDGSPNPYSNCQVVDNILIIQESDSTCPQTSSGGGTLQFDFVTPVKFIMTKLLDIPSGGGGLTQITVTYSGGESLVYPIPSAGSNGLVDVVLDVDNVSRIEILFDCFGGVAELVYQECPETAA